jgi:hypothetical protein
VYIEGLLGGSNARAECYGIRAAGVRALGDARLLLSLVASSPALDTP